MQLSITLKLFFSLNFMLSIDLNDTLTFLAWQIIGCNVFLGEVIALVNPFYFPFFLHKASMAVIRNGLVQRNAHRPVVEGFVFKNESAQIPNHRLTEEIVQVHP